MSRARTEKRTTRLLLALLAAAILPTPARANHGPGTSGGGISTQSGETLAAGAWDSTVRLDFTQYEHISAAKAAQFAQERGGFDSLERSYVANLSVAYGVTDDFEFGLNIGWYEGKNFEDAELENGVVEVGKGDPAGLTDLWMTGKYRLFENHGHLALLGGVKYPVGDDGNKLDNGEKVEPSSQPGSGAFDALAGLAYSRYLTPRLTLDTGASYTLRGSNDHFSVGDRADFGVALAWRLTDPVTAFPGFSVFGELSNVWLARDKDHGDRNDNSGGDTVYLSAGVRSRITKHFAMTLAPFVPLYQGLNGKQQEVLYKVALSTTVTF